MRILGSAWRLTTRPRLAIDTPLVVTSRVWPSDLNLGMHMDNVRYLQLMNAARNEFFLRSGMRRVMLRRGLGLPLAACEMRYRRPLMPFDAFSLRTEVLGWDSRRFYMAQRFERDGECMAEGLFRCAFTDADGVCDPGTVFEALAGRPLVSPALPEELGGDAVDRTRAAA